jgi:hypothetical protein
MSAQPEVSSQALINKVGLTKFRAFVKDQGYEKLQPAEREQLRWYFNKGPDAPIRLPPVGYNALRGLVESFLLLKWDKVDVYPNLKDFLVKMLGWDVEMESDDNFEESPAKGTTAQGKGPLIPKNSNTPVDLAMNLESPLGMSLQQISPCHYTTKSPIFNFTQQPAPITPKKLSKPPVKTAPLALNPSPVGLAVIQTEAAKLDSLRVAGDHTYPKKLQPVHQSTPIADPAADLMDLPTQRVVKKLAHSASIARPRHLEFTDPTPGLSNIMAQKCKFRPDITEDDDLQILEPEKDLNISVYQPEAMHCYTTVQGDFATMEWAERGQIILTELEVSYISFH